VHFSLSDEITASFRRFGQLVVDWPHKAESKSYFPPKGYAFLLFQVLFTDIKCGY
jgi:cytoplasmic polyadenylation element-binding protein